MDFPSNLKRLRKAAGLTQSALAERLEVSQPSVQRWENGKREPSYADLFAIANALERPVGELFNDEMETAGADTQPPAQQMLSEAELVAILNAVREPLSKGPSTEADILGLATMIYEILTYRLHHPEETRSPDMLFAAARALLSRPAQPRDASRPDTPDHK